MGRRQGPSEERRTAILAAAEEVFTEAGYAGASIREIARRAGVSSALLYWFFPNKARLFAAVIEARVEAAGVLDFPQEVFAIPPGEFLLRLGHGFVRVISQERQVGLIKLILRESDREPELINTLARVVMGRVLAPLSAYFTRQMDEGRLRRADPDYVAQAFMGMFIAAVLRREVLQEPEIRHWDLDAYVDTATAMFLAGALLPPGADRSGEG